MRVIGKLFCVILLIVVIGYGFFFYGSTVPIRLEVTGFPETIHLGEKIDVSQVHADLVSFLGKRRAVDDLSVEQQRNNLVVSHNRFKTVVGVVTLVPESFNVTYVGTVYAGKVIDPSKLSVVAVYSDGEERDVEITSVVNDVIPFAKNYAVTVETSVGEALWETDVMVPDEIKAYYNTDIEIGDAFNKDFISVFLFYPDGTELEVKEFDVDEAPEYFNEDTIIKVSCLYGTAECLLKPANQQRLSAVYDGVVYAGDTLDSSCVTLTMIGTDGAEHEIEDFWFDDIGYIKTDTRVGVHSNYGSGEAWVKVISVKECTADISGELVEGAPIEIRAIRLRYEDDTVRTLSQSDIRLSNMGSTYRGGDFDAWFEWHGMHFSFPLLVIPEEVSRLRELDPNVNGVGFRTYAFTEAQIETIAILCQRVAGDDIRLVAAEAALLANRYELYSNDMSTDGAYIVKYMKESGYWGEDVNGYISEHEATQQACFVVRDALVNGHRVFPAYVDDRVGIYNVSRINTVSYIQFQTEVTKINGDIYWFYSFVSDEPNMVYGYSDYAYQMITGNPPPYSHVTYYDDVTYDGSMDDGIEFIG